MTKVAKEIIALVDSLPAEKAREVVGFARYLADRVAEEAWEKGLADPKARAKFRKFDKKTTKK
jgi:hypothetical protein